MTSPDYTYSIFKDNEYIAQQKLIINPSEITLLSLKMTSLNSAKGNRAELLVVKSPWLVSAYCVKWLVKNEMKCEMYVYSGHALSYTKLVHRHATQTEGNKYFQMNITGLKIPTGGRQTSWLYTSMTEELN